MHENLTSLFSSFCWATKKWMQSNIKAKYLLNYKISTFIFFTLQIKYFFESNAVT